MKKTALIITSILIFLAALFLASKNKQQASIKKSDNNEAAEKQTTSQQRIISLSPNITEILFALDLGDSVAGVTTYCNYPPQAQQKTKVGSITSSDIETILSLKPTIVFTTATTLHSQLRMQLEKLGIKAVAVKVEMLNDIFTATNTIGLNCQKAQEAATLTNQIKSELHDIQNSMANVASPKTLIVIQRDPLMVCGQDTFINELLEIAGGENAIGKTMSSYPQINFETLLTCNPDIIIETAENPSKQALENAKEFYSRWSNLKAVQNDNIELINADVLSRPGPRVVEATQMLADILKTHSVITNTNNQNTIAANTFPEHQRNEVDSTASKLKVQRQQ